MPATSEATAPAATVKSENAGSIKVLDELLSKLSLSKTAEDTTQTTLSIASFINGAIEEQDAPTK
jgi:elongation factor 3